MAACLILGTYMLITAAGIVLFHFALDLIERFDSYTPDWRKEGQR
jgi:hypothetical protein